MVFCFPSIICLPRIKKREKNVKGIWGYFVPARRPHLLMLICTVIINIDAFMCYLSNTICYNHRTYMQNPRAEERQKGTRDPTYLCVVATSHYISMFYILLCIVRPIYLIFVVEDLL